MDDIDEREAELLARLEAEREQRLAEKIAAGEIVSVPLCIVAGSESEASARVEQAKADKLAELRAAGDLREVKFTVELIVTGVCKHGEATVSGEPWKPTAPPYLPGPARRDEVVEEEAVREEQPPVIESYVQVQIRQCDDYDDPGEIAEGWFSINDGVVTVTDVQ